MKYLKFFSVLLFIQFFNAQNDYSKWQLSSSFGIQNNFFVSYGRDISKEGSYFQPIPEIFGDQLFQKNSIGTQYGFELTYRISKRNIIGISYERSENHGKFKVNYLFPNNTYIYINDFQLEHVNNYFELFYKRGLGKKDKNFIYVGFYVLNPKQQEITIDEDRSLIQIIERTGTNEYNLQEGGFFIGYQYKILSSGKFDFSVISKLYFTASTGEFESLSLTPSISYNF